MKRSHMLDLAKSATILAILSLGLFLPGVVAAQTVTTVSVSAPEQVKAGEQFVVDIVVEPGVEIAGAQFDLAFDPLLVTVDSVEEGNLLSRGGADTFFRQGSIDNEAGSIDGVAGAIITPGQTVSTIGTFAAITFIAGTGVGTCPLTLSGVIVGDINGQSVEVSIVNDQVTLLEKESPVPVSGGGGGGVIGEKTITNLSGVTSNSLHLLEDVEALSADVKVKVFVKEGTKATNRKGSFVSSIIIEKLVEPPETSINTEIIGGVYNIGLSGTKFNPPALLTIAYDEDSISERITENCLYIATWNEENQEWQRMECTCDTEADCISTLLDHLSTYAIMVNTRPAEFQLSELTITPVDVGNGEDVTISVMVTNSGDLTGSYQVGLKIDDMVAQTREVILNGGDSQTVSFRVTPDTVGKHNVSIGGLLGTFEVKAPKTLATPRPVPIVAPTNFAISDLLVTPSEVNPDEQVTISATVINAGVSEGSYTCILKINGLEEAKKEVTIEAGKSEIVTFTIAKDTEGSYTVNINGKAGHFTVVQLPPLPKQTRALPFQPPTDNWWLVGGMIAGCVFVVGLLVYFFVW